MSSFLRHTTAFAYIEWAARHLEAQGHDVEIRSCLDSGRLVLRMDGSDRTVDEIGDALSPHRVQPDPAAAPAFDSAHRLRAAAN